MVVQAVCLLPCYTNLELLSHRRTLSCLMYVFQYLSGVLQFPDQHLCFVRCLLRLLSASILWTHFLIQSNGQIPQISGLESCRPQNGVDHVAVVCDMPVLFLGHFLIQMVWY